MTELDYSKLTAYEKVTIEYHGSGDEGFIEGITGLPIDLDSDELEKYLESWAYDLLEENWGGWEINEGSQGTITIDVKAREVHVHHGENVEQVNWSDHTFA